MSSPGKPNDAPAPVDGDGGTVVVVTPPAPQAPTAGTEEIARIEARIAEIETSITQSVEGNRQWTETHLSPLRQEIADLKTTLQQVGHNLPEQMQSLRAELTQSLQDLALQLPKAPAPPAPPELAPGTVITATQVTPPETPPDVDAEDPVKTKAPEPRKGKKRLV